MTGFTEFFRDQRELARSDAKTVAARDELRARIAGLGRWTLALVAALYLWWRWEALG